MDASEFYDRIPLGDTINAGLGGGDSAWLFNNSILNLGSKEEAAATVTIPEAGTWHLFVRSRGVPGSGFRVSINGRAGQSVYGDGPLTLKSGETFELPKGPVEIRLTGIDVRAALNVIVLSKNANFTEADSGR